MHQPHTPTSPCAGHCPGVQPTSLRGLRSWRAVKVDTVDGPRGRPGRSPEGQEAEGGEGQPRHRRPRRVILAEGAWPLREAQPGPMPGPQAALGKCLSN